MNNSIKLVEEFHQVFNHTIETKPTIPPAGTIDFRTNFIYEELKELADAAKENDIVGIADALGDIQYVLDGFFLNCGLHDRKEEILAAIHTSNMTKACTSLDHALETIKSLKNVGTEAYYEQVGKYWIVKRSSDGKVMKALGYSAPKLNEIVNR